MSEPQPPRPGDAAGDARQSEAGSFSDIWLALREPADARARADRLERALLGWLARHRAASGVPLRVVDLGAGTGSNFRHLAPHLGHAQQWRLLDNDAELLTSLRSRLVQWAGAAACQWRADGDSLWVGGAAFSAHLQCLRVDLSAPIGQWWPLAFAGFDRMPEVDIGTTDGIAAGADTGTADGAALVAGAELVTASALLDLVGERWLEALTAKITARGCAALFALNYDGSVSWSPPHPADASMLEAFNAHQRLDKGLGTALGPLAAHRAAGLFDAAGYDVSMAASPWLLDAAEAGLVGAIIEDWSDTMGRWRPDQATLFSQWREQRRDMLAQSSLRISHQDVLALPKSQRRQPRRSKSHITSSPI